MENQFLSFNFISFLVFFSLIFLLAKGKKKLKHQNLPPSPWKLPLIGHIHHLIGAAPPHHLIRSLSKRYGPIIHLQLGEVYAIFISSSEIAKELFKVHDIACADRPESIGLSVMWYEYSDIAFSPYNDYWRQMRKVLIIELLSAKNVRSFGSIRLDEASSLIGSIRSSSGSGKPINLTEKIFTFTSSMTCRAAFGKVLRDRTSLIKLMKEGVAMAGGFDLADFFPSSKLAQAVSWNKNRLWKMRGKLDLILDSMIDEHKDNLARTKTGNGDSGAEDIVDVLLRLQQNGQLDIPITNENIKAIIFDMFSAGTETSSSIIDWAMAEMMRNPHVMAKAQEEVRQVLKGTFEDSDLQSLKYLKLVIKETFRLHPAFPFLPRACREDCEINGYTVPRKARVMVNIWALGRDPKYWQEPEVFKPERFENSSVDFLGNNFEFIPFGGGRRICPGINFGLANIELPLAQFLYHFNWKLPDGMKPSDVDMNEGSGISVPRKNELYLIPTPFEPVN